MTIYSIQYLRAIAALMVAANHAITYPFDVETGEQGVDIFFVISGFIMVYIMEKNQRSWSRFLKARFFRIAPLYYLCTIFAVIIGYIEIPNLLHSIQTVTFIKFYKTSPPLAVGWTLEYEFIFYLLCSKQFQNCFLLFANNVSDLLMYNMRMMLKDFVLCQNLFR